MADLFALLVQSGNSLAAHSAAVATAGNNVANVNTPGYSRQIANLAANASLGALGSLAVGTGVSLQSITQARDQFLERQMPSALAAQAGSQTESDALASVTALNPDLDGGVGSALSNFYTSLRTLTQNPGDTALRQSFIGSSQALATAFNRTVGSIEQARSGVDANLQGTIDAVNSASTSLADLNRQIDALQSSGGQANDLKDLRQKQIDQLATLTGGAPFTNSAGDISIAMPGGTTLVLDVHAAKLSAVPDPANLGHLKVQITHADGSGPVDLAPGGIGGTIGGLLTARDGGMKAAVTSLDTMAFDLAGALNTVHQAGFAMDGTGARNLFTVPLTSTDAAGGHGRQPEHPGAAGHRAADAGQRDHAHRVVPGDRQQLRHGQLPCAGAGGARRGDGQQPDHVARLRLGRLDRRGDDQPDEGPEGLRSGQQGHRHGESDARHAHEPEMTGDHTCA